MKNIIKKFSYWIIIFLLITPAYSMKSNINKNSKINIYGNIKILNYINTKNKNNNEHNNIMLFGIKKNFFNKNINIFSKLEGNLINNKIKNTHFNINISYIGIKIKKLGSISYGKNHNILYNTLCINNIFPYNNSKFIKKNILNNYNNIFTYNKKFKFNNKFINFINIKTQYQGNISNNKNILNSTKNSWGIEYNYNTNYGINISASYLNKIIKNINKNKNNNNKILLNNILSNESKIWSTSIKYNLNNIYISTSYSKGTNFIPILSIIKSSFYDEKVKKYFLDKNSENISIIIKYNFKNISTIIGYIQTIANNIEKMKITKNIYTPNSIDLEKYFNLSLIYNFNNSLNTYIDYKINQINKNNFIKIDNNNLITLGLIYKF